MLGCGLVDSSQGGFKVLNNFASDYTIRSVYILNIVNLILITICTYYT